MAATERSAIGARRHAAILTSCASVTPNEQDMVNSNAAVVIPAKVDTEWANGYTMAKDATKTIHEYGVITNDAILIASKALTDKGKCRKPLRGIPEGTELIGSNRHATEIPANNA